MFRPPHSRLSATLCRLTNRPLLGMIVFAATRAASGQTFSILHPNLYGTTYREGNFGGGSVFKATRSGGSWVCADLHDFLQEGNCVFPVAGVTLDAAGNLYGSTYSGGSRSCETGCGVLWKITP